ncbi:nuclear transport factor 2 family protein [Chelonobacter oris]|uniref:nuclear transport factor 2 family protein n=1 Tax=Chelonobacter oris TaxID=505317 RepID=UPI000ADAAA96|nr:nuclear transport factor 2 family protein [Chelonobacter oris]
MCSGRLKTPKVAIAYIDIGGTAASARVDTDDLNGFGFADYFNLLKIEGKWTIVSKIFHTHYAEV